MDDTIAQQRTFLTPKFPSTGCWHWQLAQITNLHPGYNVASMRRLFQTDNIPGHGPSVTASFSRQIMCNIVQALAGAADLHTMASMAINTLQECHLTLTPPDRCKWSWETDGPCILTDCPNWCGASGRVTDCNCYMMATCHKPGQVPVFSLLTGINLHMVQPSSCRPGSATNLSWAELRRDLLLPPWTSHALGLTRPLVPSALQGCREEGRAVEGWCLSPLVCKNSEQPPCCVRAGFL